MRHRYLSPFLCTTLTITLLSCGDREIPDEVADTASETAARSDPAEPAAARDRIPLFGDLHVHSSISLDSYIVFARNSPDDVFRFARGQPIELYGGATARLSTPLDFVALTEHAEFLGELGLCRDTGSSAYGTDTCRDIRNEAQDRVVENRVYRNVMLRLIDTDRPVRLDICGEQGETCLAAGRTAWQEVQRLSDAYNEPGVFTALIGYEWSAEYLGNQHRNVIFRNAEVPDTAWSAVEFATPEELWQQLGKTCTSPCEALTISHNSNQSRGLRFRETDSDGSPLTAAQAATRLRYEPLVEISQIKGQSECRTGFGTVDEDCNFELFDLAPLCQPDDDRERCITACENDDTGNCIWSRNYIRNALNSGLALDQRLGFNPFKVGFVGSTDTHNSNPGDTDEDSYAGSFGFLESDPEERLMLSLQTGYKQLSRNPGGLAGVWAAQNTRDSIFDALKRRETFATSGTRIVVRFFAGWDYPARPDEVADLVSTGYENGVAMGGDLPPGRAGSPRFIVWARKGANDANLHKAQIIKGWLEEGTTHERVYDVACADGQAPDPPDARCPASEATVDLTDCKVSARHGDAELVTIWSDPDFDHAQKAFYYLRVLQVPTCRWSTYDALRLGREPPAEVSPVIHERAWSSPIWYRPDGG